MFATRVGLAFVWSTPSPLTRNADSPSDVRWASGSRWKKAPVINQVLTRAAASLTAAGAPVEVLAAGAAAMVAEQGRCVAHLEYRL